MIWSILLRAWNKGRALFIYLFILPKSANVDTREAAVGGRHSPTRQQQNYDAGDGEVYTEPARRSLVHAPLLEGSLQVRNLDWRQGRLETDWQRIRPYCGTAEGRRPDTRGYVWVIDIWGLALLASVCVCANELKLDMWVWEMCLCCLSHNLTVSYLLYLFPSISSAGNYKQQEHWLRNHWNSDWLFLMAATQSSHI